MRATVLLAVLLVVAIGAMIGTSVMYFSQAETAGVVHGMRAAQSRAAAWSGVQAVMAQLAKQRTDLLAGRGTPPNVPETGVVSEDERGERRSGGGGGRRLVFRIVPDRRGNLVQSETAKLDASTATAEMLSHIPGLSAEIATRIVSVRNTAGRWQSTLDLLSVEGIRAEGLLGIADSDSGSRGAFHPPTPPMALADLLTVFAFDPQVQSGLDAEGRCATDRTGKSRVRLFEGSADQLRGALDGRIASGAVDSLIAGRNAKGRTGAIRTSADLVKMLRGTPPADWAAVLDVVATEIDEFATGRLDINRAPAEALGAVPGIDAASAARMVEVRDRLDESRRASICWPLLEGILTADQFEAAAPYLTVRSLQWRVVVEGGWQEGEPLGAPGLEAPRTTLSDATVLEAVIDVSDTRPRVAYLRDISLRPVAATLARVSIASPLEGKDQPTSEPTPSPPPPPPADYRPARPDRADERKATPAGGPKDRTRPVRPQAGPGRIGRWTTGVPAAGGTR